MHPFFNAWPVQPKESAASEYPIPQEHSNEPYVLVQIWVHPPLLVWHSSISVQQWLLIICRNNCHSFLPSQPRLFAASRYPTPQVHTKELKVFVQVWLHPPLSVWHSSRSVKVGYNNIAVQWWLHTFTAEVIWSKCIPSSTWTFKWARGISACLITSSIVSLTLIHIWLHFFYNV